jgi:hypothetical protein
MMVKSVPAAVFQAGMILLLTSAVSVALRLYCLGRRVAS